MTKSPRPFPRLEILGAALKLGCTSFGGPAAHIGYFHGEYVERRRWLSEAAFADLVAMSQFLPGPASSQLGFAVGLLRGGLPGGLLAWVGFTLPSAVAMILCGYGMAALNRAGEGGWLKGLKLAAVAVVAQAVWVMASRLCSDRVRASLALLIAGAALLLPLAAWTQVAILAAGGLIGWLFLRPEPRAAAGTDEAPLSVPGLGYRGALLALVLFFALLIALPVVSAATGSPVWAVADSFYRTGSLVFGGGHVVLPLLRAETVARGWVSNAHFLAGYGLAQAVPGPLFTFAAYLGTVLTGPRPHGWIGGILCLAAIFLPSGLLVVGVLPFWEVLRRQPAAQAALGGLNAAVVGLLLATLYQPVWITTVHGPTDFVLALAAYGLLVLWRVPPWLVVMLAAVAGEAFL